MSRSRQFHISPYKPLTVKPSAGGKLMSNLSPDTAGIYNYTVKRDFRRVLDKEVRSEGYDYFWPNTSIPLGQQPFPNYPAVNEPITLEIMARQPNGRTAIIVGTPTTLFRYFALDNGAYFEGDGTPAEYYQNEGQPGTPYYDDNPGIWLVIGTGFSPNAQRWEAINTNGYLVLNNGVDLMVTYRVEEFEVRPIYEMREAGIASVGNIALDNSGLLVCADISEIDEAELVNILSLISSNGITASQAGSYGPSPFNATLVAGTVTSANPIFNLGSVGQTITFVNGISATINGYLTPTTVAVTNATDTVNPGIPFFLINPGTIDYTVVASAPIFDNTMAGRKIVWDDSGATVTITAFIDSTHVVVNSNSSIPAGTFGLNNPAAYAPYTDQNFISRIQYRIIWCMEPDEPRRFAAVVPGTILIGSNSLKLQYPALSFQELVGQQITILGAGVNAGNLTATLEFLAPDGMTCILDAVASTSVTNAGVQAADATGSLAGFMDLQDDGSPIIGMLSLLGYLVVYKDTAIMLGQYTGTIGSVFNFNGLNKYTGSKTLYYRYTLIKISAGGQDFHVFAGRNSFYRFDLVNQEPIEVETGEVCKNIFFNSVQLLPPGTDNVGVFAADNPITKQVFFCFPKGPGLDKALIYDYFTGQVNTTSAAYTAAAAVKRPVTGIQTGASEDWFIMGTSNGMVVKYGLTDTMPFISGGITCTQAGNTMTASAPFFSSDLVIGRSIQFPDLSVVNVVGYISPTQITVGGPAKTRVATQFSVISALWHRIGQPYDSVLASGLESFGKNFGEKDIEAWVLTLAGESPNSTLLFELIGGTSPSKTAVLGSRLFTNAEVQNAVGMLFRQNYFADRITVSGMNNPLEIVQRVLNIAGVDSRAFTER